MFKCNVVYIDVIIVNASMAARPVTIYQDKDNGMLEPKFNDPESMQRFVQHVRNLNRSNAEGMRAMALIKHTIFGHAYSRKSGAWDTDRSSKRTQRNIAMIAYFLQELTADMQALDNAKHNLDMLNMELHDKLGIFKQTVENEIRAGVRVSKPDSHYARDNITSLISLVFMFGSSDRFHNIIDYHPLHHFLITLGDMRRWPIHDLYTNASSRESAQGGYPTHCEFRGTRVDFVFSHAKMELMKEILYVMWVMALVDQCLLHYLFDFHAGPKYYVKIRVAQNIHCLYNIPQLNCVRAGKSPYMEIVELIEKYSKHGQKGTLFLQIDPNSKYYKNVSSTYSDLDPYHKQIAFEETELRKNINAILNQQQSYIAQLINLHNLKICQMIHVIAAKKFNAEKKARKFVSSFGITSRYLYTNVRRHEQHKYSEHDRDILRLSTWWQGIDSQVLYSELGLAAQYCALLDLPGFSIENARKSAGDSYAEEFLLKYYSTQPVNRSLTIRTYKLDYENGKTRIVDQYNASVKAMSDLGADDWEPMNAVLQSYFDDAKTSWINDVTMVSRIYRYHRDLTLDNAPDKNFFDGVDLKLKF